MRFLSGTGKSLACAFAASVVSISARVARVPGDGTPDHVAARVAEAVWPG